MIRARRIERVYLKLLFGGIAVLILLAALVTGGHRFYRSWQTERLTRHAESYLNEGNLKSASILARHLLDLDSSNTRACRIMAQTAERTGDPAAVEWWKRVLKNAPDSLDDAVALGRSALRFNQLDAGEKALQKMEAKAGESAAYYEVRGKLALARGVADAAQPYLAKAADLDPGNKHYRFDRAIAQLQATSSGARTAGRNSLEQFLEDRELRTSAARALRDDAARRHSAPALLEASALLAGYEEAAFSDRLAHAKILHALDQAGFATTLSQLQTEAATEPEKMAELLSWMSADGLALVALHWIKDLPPEILNKRPVPVAVADCYVAVNDPDEMEQLCNQSPWGDLEFARETYLSWALRKRGDSQGFDAHWKKALELAGGDPERLHTIEQVCVKWGWEHEAENVLWMMAKDPRRQAQSLSALYDYYAKKGDTRNLYRVVARFSERNADDDKAQNNLAQLSLLLNLNVRAACEIADRLYRKDPRNRLFVTTYAFSLYRRGQHALAVKAMNQLDAADLQEPGTAAYYGLVLAAAGEKTKAADFIEKGIQAPLLPEEKALLQEARNKTGTNRR